ncbi:myosin heavy chain, non-muscle-like [Artemia franciscana]|uniref:myosin heavy chain, non-muscle-like n=1 Tax=Artemia franciscana TaxID=6661 RepID=UPI0032DB5DE8
MDSSIRNQPTADGTSIVREILASEQILETAAERVLSTNEAVRVDVFPAHLRETSFDIWLHSSTKEIADPISNTIVSSGGTMTSSADGQISSFVNIDLKQVVVDELLTKHHKSKELLEERSLASERPSSPTSSKSFEVLAWVANHEQSSNEHQLKRLDSLDIEMDGHRTGRIMNKSQESCFHSSVISAASKISHVDDAVQCDGENEVRCAQGQEFEMVNGCNSTCHENLRTQSASTTCLTQPLLKSILDAMETKFEAFRRIIKAELGRPDHPDLPPKLFLEYMEACRFNGDKEEVASTVIRELRHIRQQMSSQARKMDEFLEKAESDKQQRLKATCAEQQTTEIRLQNALTELEITRAEMVKVQRESVRKLALESSKHTEEISTFEKGNAATANALEQIQTEARLFKSSLESSLSKNESALVQLGKTKGQLEEALDRENSLKLELKELQNQLSAMVKEKDEYSYKHAEEISSLEAKNAATFHALEQSQTEASQLKSSLENFSLKNESDLMHLAKTEGQLEEAIGRENSLKLELKELQNHLSAVVKKKDEDSFSGEGRPKFRGSGKRKERQKTKKWIFMGPVPYPLL